MFAAVPAFPREYAEFKLTQELGPYGVGLRIVHQYDYSRTFGPLTDDLGKARHDERARPMQTLIWYPADSRSGRRMTVRDYAMLWASQARFSEPKMPLIAADRLAGLSKSLNQELWAVSGSRAAIGRFPVVIYSPGLSSLPTPWENADLCEYLASHGYLVVAAPNLGIANHRVAADLSSVETQARDISFLVGYAGTLPNADNTRVAVIGFSWGGLANLFAAARDSRITALVGLDGSLRYFPGLVQQAPDIHPERMSIPLLYFEEGDFSLEDEDRLVKPSDRNGANVLNQWAQGDLTVIHVMPLTHFEFSAMEQRNEDRWLEFQDPELPSHQNADYSRAEGAIAYGWVARYTLAFLDAAFKHDPSATEFLKATPAHNGVPEHFVSVRFRAGAGGLGNFDAFKAALHEQGFSGVENILHEMEKSDPTFNLDLGDVIAWADSLMDEEHTSEALAVLQLSIKIWPDSAQAYLELGHVFRRLNQLDRAMECYQASLKRDPIRQAAKIELRKLLLH